MKKNTTKTAAIAADIMLFDNWFDLYKLTLDLTDGVSWPLSVQAAWVSSMA